MRQVIGNQYQCKADYQSPRIYPYNPFAVSFSWLRLRAKRLPRGGLFTLGDQVFVEAKILLPFNASGLCNLN
jgi:hypothetical protein